MITLSLDPDIQELTAGLNHLSWQIQTAIKRAVRKLILWIRRQMLRQASRMTGVPQKEIVRYRRIYLDIEGMEGTVWLGTSPLPLHIAGRVNWNSPALGRRSRGASTPGPFTGMFTAAAPRSGYDRVETSRRDTPPTTENAVTGPFPMRSATAGSRWSCWVPRRTNSKTKSPGDSSEGRTSAFGSCWPTRSTTP